MSGNEANLKLRKVWACSGPWNRNGSVGPREASENAVVSRLPLRPQKKVGSALDQVVLDSILCYLQTFLRSLAQPCGAMKMTKFCKEGTAANRRRSGSEGHRSKTWRQQGLFPVESLLKCTLPPEICIYNINSRVRCAGWLYICFTCERCDMSLINKRSTRLVATFKKLFSAVYMHSEK